MAQKKLIKKKGGVIIRQANEIIEARYNFSLWEMRIFKTMLAKISPQDDGFREETISVGELLKKYGKSDGGSIYDIVREAATNVKSRFVYLPYVDDNQKRRLKILPLFASVDIPLEEDEYDNYVKLQFNEVLKPYLIKLQNRYTAIDEEILAGMDSAYTMRVYDLVKENEFKTKGEFEFDDFREMVGAKEYDEKQHIIKDVFKTWQDVKINILETAQEHINEKTDVSFQFEPVLEYKTGRGRKKVIGVRFFAIKANQKRYEENYVVIDETEDRRTQIKEVVDLVHKHKITKYTVSTWFDKYPVEQIYKGVFYSLEQFNTGKVKDIAGYLQRMVATPDLFDPLEEQRKTKETQQKKKQEQQKIVALEKNKELELNSLKSQLYQEKKQTVLDIITSDSRLYISILQLLRKEVGESKNPITQSALQSYTPLQGDKNGTFEEFIHNFKQGGSFTGYVVSRIQKLHQETFDIIIQKYQKKAIELGFKETAII